MSEYFVTKTWAAQGRGTSTAFRNWRAQSHCRLNHGYDLVFATTFACAPENLTPEGWVVGFGDLAPIKQAIESTFDHKTIVAEDDPELEWFREGERRGILELSIMPAIGCEAFSAWLARISADCLYSIGRLGIVRIKHAVVTEHGSNQAGFEI